ncbi:MAG TPA: nuclease [Rhodospirillaceae bacterium]|nr:nuclease [Rhodospirillaceae bacterium]|tara:strand:- start:1874 stop:2299 length:426 start_codon:yes stop_codon:yes gene_type:complete
MGQFISIFAVLILLTNSAQAAELTGTVTHVRDGDTIEVEGIAVRLQGVSAPEKGRPLYDEGKAFMVQLVAGRFVRCELNGERSHDRVIGVCFLDHLDIGGEVIKAGLALDCPRFSGGRYTNLETPAAHKAIKLPPYCIPRN